MAKHFGTYNPDGSIESYPTHDINGTELTGRPATTWRPAGSNRFVALPANFSDQEALDKWAAQYGQIEPPINTLISGSKTLKVEAKTSADS